MRVAVSLALALVPMAAAFSPSSVVLPSFRPAAAAARCAAPPQRATSRSQPLGLRMTAATSMDASPALENLKGDLMTQLSVGSGLKGAADPANRAEINEMVLKLEPMNPTELATSSPLLNGVWELLYTGGFVVCVRARAYLCVCACVCDACVCL